MPRPRLFALCSPLLVLGAFLPVVHAQTSYPNDPLYPAQWALHNTGAAGGVEGVDLQMPEAWKITRCSASVKIAMLDTGVDPNQPDLAGKLLPGKSFVPGVSSWSDDNGHGTQTAGVVAADTNNGIGIAGICPEGKILPVKVADAQGHTGDETGDVQVANGIRWAVKQGARILNLSLSTPDSPPMRAAVDYAWRHNALIVAATDGGDVFPADYPHVLAVDGMNNKGVLDHNSTHGAENLVIAPDASIFTTQRGGQYGVFCQCVSIAAPQVAGVAALLLSIRPNLTADQMMRAIERGAVNMTGQETRNSVQGYGRADAYRALRVARKMPAFTLALNLPSKVKAGASETLSVHTIRLARLSALVTYPNHRTTVLTGRADRSGAYRFAWKVGAGSGRASVAVTAYTSAQGAFLKSVHFTVA